MLRRLAIVAVLVAIAVAAYSLGVVDLLRDPERVKAMLLDWGAWGYVVYLASFVLLEPLGVPGLLWIVPASLVWPKPLAFVLSLAGGTGAGLVGFLFARFLARDWVEKNLPERFRRFDDRLGENGFQAVVLIRFVFFLAPPSHWVLGISKVRIGPFLAGSIVGIAPGVAAATWVGGSLFAWLGNQPAWVWLCMGGGLLGLVLLRRVFAGKKVTDAESTS